MSRNACGNVHLTRLFAAFSADRQTNFLLLLSRRSRRGDLAVEDSLVTPGYFVRAMGKRIAAALCIYAQILLLTVAPSIACAQKFRPFVLDRSRPLQIDTSGGEVRILAELQPEKFSGGWLASTPNYHAVVWKDGGAASEAFLTSPVSDTDLYDAMLAIGAVPGNNLTMAAWKDRKDPASTAPDQRVEGTPVQVLVWWEGLAAPLPLKDLLLDSGGRGIDMRFGGNKALIPEWHSGCIACLYSCPGGKVSNHAYTIRDYVSGTTKFDVNWSNVPKGTRQALVIFRKR